MNEQSLKCVCVCGCVCTLHNAVHETNVCTCVWMFVWDQPVRLTLAPDEILDKVRSGELTVPTTIQRWTLEGR